MRNDWMGGQRWEGRRWFRGQSLEQSLLTCTEIFDRTYDLLL